MALYKGETITEQQFKELEKQPVLGAADPSALFRQSAPESAASPSNSPAMKAVEAAEPQFRADFDKTKEKAKFVLPSFFGDTTTDMAVLGGAAALGAAATQVPKMLRSLKDLNKSSKSGPAVAEPTVQVKAEPTIVKTAGGPINLDDLPEDYRSLVAKSAATTEQKLASRAATPSLSGAMDVPEVPKFTAPAPVAPPAPIAQSATPVAPVAPAAVVGAPTGPAAALEAVPAAPAPAVEGPVAPPATKAPKGAKAPVVAPGTVGPGDKWLYNNLGPDYKAFIDTYNNGKPVGSYKNAIDLWGNLYAGPKVKEIPSSVMAERGIAPPAKGGSFGAMPAELASAAPAEAPAATKGAKVPESQRGSAPLGAMANVALNAAGGLMLLDMFKKAQQTGDYSDFALGAIGQVLGNVAPRGASIGFSLMQPNTVSSGTLDSPEAQEMMRRRNAGAGRGFVNPPMAR